MAKYLNDVSIWVCSENEAEKWGSSSNSLETLYLYHLPKVESGGVCKVSIVPCRTLPPEPLELVLRNPDIFQLSKLFDFKKYSKAGKEAKKRIALDFLHEGLLEVAKIKKWKKKPFQDAYKAVLAKNFVNYLPWCKPVTSPNRKYKAQAWCNFDSDKAEIFVVFFHRKEIVGRTWVTNVIPGNVCIRNAIYKLNWISDTKVQLTPRFLPQIWEVSVPPNPAMAGK